MLTHAYREAEGAAQNAWRVRPIRSPDSILAGMQVPEHIETNRLVLRKPTAADAEAIYERYASDAEVTKYLGWPRHQSIEETKAFLAHSEAEWNRWPAGPYLIECRGDRKLLGGTGFTFEAPTVAITGYVLARDAWGYGYATEALSTVVALTAC